MKEFNWQENLFVSKPNEELALKHGLTTVLVTDHNDIIYQGVLYQQIVDWFREKYKIDIGHVFYTDGYNFKLKFINPTSTIIDINSANYYEAFNKAIEEAFKLI